MCKKFLRVAAGAVKFSNTRSRFKITLFGKIKKSIICFNYSPTNFFEGCRQRYSVKKRLWEYADTQRRRRQKIEIVSNASQKENRIGNSIQYSLIIPQTTIPPQTTR